MVGDSQSFLPELVERAKKLKANGGFEKGTDLFVMFSLICVFLIDILLFRGPLISPAAKAKVTGLIASAEEEGGTIHLDGRGLQVPDYPNGNFVGPTIISGAPGMRCYEYVPLFGFSEIIFTCACIDRKYSDQF